jgi:hypothetical protein
LVGEAAVSVGEAVGVNVIVAVGKAVGDDVGISVSAVVGVKIVGVDIGAGVGVWVGDAVAMDGVVDGEGMDSTVALGGSVLGTAVLQPKNTRSTQPPENAKNEPHSMHAVASPLRNGRVKRRTLITGTRTHTGGYGWIRVYSRRTPSQHSTVSCALVHAALPTEHLNP